MKKTKPKEKSVKNPTFTVPEDCDPLAAASQDRGRPVLHDAFICRATNPFTGENGVYLATTDSYIAAFVPLETKRWRRKKQVTVPAAALRAALENGRTFELEADGRVQVDGTSYAVPDTKGPDLAAIVSELDREKRAPGACEFSINPILLQRLSEALGSGKWTKRKVGRPPRLTWTAPNAPLFVEIPPFEGAFGVLMPVRLHERREDDSPEESSDSAEGAVSA